MYVFSPSMNLLWLWNRYWLDDVWVCAFLKSGNCVNLWYFSRMNGWCGFHCNNVWSHSFIDHSECYKSWRISVILIGLGWRVFIRSILAGYLHAFLSPYPVVCCYGVCWVWNTLCHCVSFHLGMGSFMLLMFVQWVMIFFMPKGLLKVDFYFSSLFYLIILRLIGKTTRVIPYVF